MSIRRLYCNPGLNLSHWLSHLRAYGLDLASQISRHTDWDNLQKYHNKRDYTDQKEIITKPFHSCAHTAPRVYRLLSFGSIHLSYIIAALPVRSITPTARERHPTGLHPSRTAVKVNICRPVADAMVGTFFAPQFLFENFITHPTGTVGDVLCKTLTGKNFSWIAALASGFTLVYVELERFYAVVKITKQKLKRIVPACWISDTIYDAFTRMEIFCLRETLSNKVFSPMAPRRLRYPLACHRWNRSSNLDDSALFKNNLLATGKKRHQQYPSRCNQLKEKNNQKGHHSQYCLCSVRPSYEHMFRCFPSQSQHYHFQWHIFKQQNIILSAGVKFLSKPVCIHVPMRKV